MGFRQHRHPGYAAVGGEMMEVDVQERGVRRLDRRHQRALDVGHVVEMPCLAQIEDQVGAGKGLAVAGDEVVLGRKLCATGERRTCTGSGSGQVGRNRWRRCIRRALRAPQVHPQFEASGHQNTPPNQKMSR